MQNWKCNTAAQQLAVQLYYHDTLNTILYSASTAVLLMFNNLMKYGCRPCLLQARSSFACVLQPKLSCTCCCQQHDMLLPFQSAISPNQNALHFLQMPAYLLDLTLLQSDSHAVGWHPGCLSEGLNLNLNIPVWPVGSILSLRALSRCSWSALPPTPTAPCL